MNSKKPINLDHKRGLLKSKGPTATEDGDAKRTRQREMRHDEARVRRNSSSEKYASDRIHHSETQRPHELPPFNTTKQIANADISQLWATRTQWNSWEAMTEENRLITEDHKTETSIGSTVPHLRLRPPASSGVGERDRLDLNGERWEISNLVSLRFLNGDCIHIE